MMQINQAKKFVHGKAMEQVVRKLYGKKSSVQAVQVERYTQAIDTFQGLFPHNDDIHIFSTPGRTEVGGNHTDHNAGRVLAAAVDLDVIAIVSCNDSDTIVVQSEGYPIIRVDIQELTPQEGEVYTSAALIRGVCARLHELGYAIGGFNAYITSNVLKGSGLSSSAAFEVLMVTIIDYLFNNHTIDDILNAQVAQYAENHFFMKPCGLMDQTACAVGGFVTIDFNDFEHPIVEKVDFDFEKSGYTLVITDTGGSHDDLNDDYTALEHEMKEVARALGGEVLREFCAEKVLGNMAQLRTRVNDRAILRALHFYSDDQRVVDQVEALRTGDLSNFMNLIIESGYSSWMLCQNCYANSNYKEQGVSVALTLAESMLKGKGAWRVHGGGFAGTIQAFVPNNMVIDYVQKMQTVFGSDSCYELYIRPVGTYAIL